MQPGARVQRIALSESIAAELSHAILTGVLEPGTFLREGELSTRFGVSRQSLRAAMLELLHVGLLRREMNRGFWVPELTREDVEDVYDLRELFDGEAARRIVEGRLSVDAAESVLQRLGMYRPDAVGPDVISAHFDFHREFVRAAGSERLLRFYDALYPETWLSLGRATVNAPVANVAGLVAHHRVLIDAVRSEDTDAAVRLARGHVAEARPTALGSVSTTES
jgi:DNA-binding GntR family transcriptional regulator